MSLNYAGGFAETVTELADYEKAGLDIVFVPEAYSYDAVSQLGFIAARTSRLQIASGILQIYTRTPSLTAMTAAGLDYVSGGRFTLGIGASGMTFLDYEIPRLLGEPLAGLLLTCVGVPAYRHRPDRKSVV